MSIASIVVRQGSTRQIDDQKPKESKEARVKLLKKISAYKELRIRVEGKFTTRLPKVKGQDSEYNDTT